tara:strand:+ start:591 stop:1547 length:957 start_codon:yes stop_codon:yes gene_type:complete
LKILIFGYSGQICKKVIVKLSQLGDVTVATRQKLDRDGQLEEMNIVTKKIINYTKKELRGLINNENPDIIINTLAAGSVRANKDNIDTIKYINSELPSSIAEILKIRDHKKKRLMITFGSTAEFEGYDNESFIETKTAPKPVSDYAIAKTQGYERLVDKIKESNILNLHLVLGSVYGGDEHKSRLIPKIITSLTSKTELTILESGNKRDYVNINDIVDAISFGVRRFRCNEFKPDGVSKKLLCVTGYRKSNTEILDLMAKILNKNKDHIEIKQGLKRKTTGGSLNYCPNDFEDFIGKKVIEFNEMSGKAMYRVSVERD